MSVPNIYKGFVKFNKKLRCFAKINKQQGWNLFKVVEIRYSAQSAFTVTSLVIFMNLSKIILLRDEMPCR